MPKILPCVLRPSQLQHWEDRNCPSSVFSPVKQDVMSQPRFPQKQDLTGLWQVQRMKIALLETN